MADDEKRENSCPLDEYVRRLRGEIVAKISRDKSIDITLCGTRIQSEPEKRSLPTYLNLLRHICLCIFFPFYSLTSFMFR